MEDQEMQAQFIQWLAQKTGVKTEDELKQVIMKLQSDKGQMQQVMQEFQAEMSGGQGQPTMQRAGGKLAYLRCLSQFKKGGNIDCGCGGTKMQNGGDLKAMASKSDSALDARAKQKVGKTVSENVNTPEYKSFSTKQKQESSNFGKVTLSPKSQKKLDEQKKLQKKEVGGQIPKAFLGAIMNAVKGAGAIAKGGASIAKGAKTLSTINKVAGIAGQVAGAVKPLMGSRPVGTSTNAVGDKGYQTMPNINTPTMPSFQVGMVNNPNQVPGGSVLYQGNKDSVDNTPMITEKGGKLRAKKTKK